MKRHPLLITYVSQAAMAAMPPDQRGVFFSVGFFCLAMATSACKKSETVQAEESATSVADLSKSRIGERNSRESVKDILLFDKNQSDALAEQRLQSIGDVGTSELVTTIRSLNLADDANDRVILGRLFLALAKKDPEKFFEMLNGLPGEYYKTAVFQAFPYLAKEYPEILQDRVLMGDFNDKRDRWLMLGACEVLGKESPKRALMFFDEMSDEKKHGPLGIILLKQAASKEPNLVVDFLSRNRTAPYFTGLFRDVLYTVLENDPSLALKLASSYPEVQDTHLSAGIHASLIRKNTALGLNEMSSATPEVRVEILTRRGFDDRTYFAKLFSEDPVKTIELLHGIAPSTANARLFKEAADRLSKLRAGPVRDSSVRSFAEAIRSADPKTADLWIESLRSGR